MNTEFDDEIRYKLLKLIKEEPKLTQREMNERMGVSLGKINYCISSFSSKGLVRIVRFKNSANKTAYLYQITPVGVAELARLTVSFLKSKLREYDRIKHEIKLLYGHICQENLNLDDTPELHDELRKII